MACATTPLKVRQDDVDMLARLGRAIGAQRVHVLHAVMNAVRRLTPEQQIELVRKHYEKPVYKTRGMHVARNKGVSQ